MDITEEEKAAVKRARDREASRRYRERNPEKLKASRKKSYENNKEKRLAAHKAWFQKNKDNPERKAKANALARRGHSARMQAEAIAVTGKPKPDVCDVCRQGGKICYDHCHSTDKFRGWLCNSCNLALGHVKDNVQTLKGLAKYVEDHLGLC